MKKRILSLVLVAALLVCVFLPPPRAEALVLTGVTIGAAVGVMILAAVGINFTQSALGETETLGTKIYEIGQSLIDAITVDGSYDSWLDYLTTIISGGTLQQVDVEVPAAVLEFSRQWANLNYDFTSGDIEVSSLGISDQNGNVIYFPSMTSAMFDAC